MKSKLRHGGAVSAPDEEAFVPGESPKPPRVGRRKTVDGTSEPPPKGGALGAAFSVFKLGLGVVLVVGASLAVAWSAHRYALSTPRFAIRKLEISGVRKRPDAEVAKLAGVKPGDNIFALDTARAEARVLEDPWVKEVKITRELPSTLKIELTEREAAGIAAVDDQMYLVTKTGEPFKALKDGDPFDLPVVTGISARELARDRDREIERIAMGMDVLKQWERISLSKTYPAQEVNLEPGGNVTLTIGKAGITLALGRGPWRKKLLMAERVMGQLARKGRTPGIIFLDNQAHPERVVVRMR